MMVEFTTQLYGVVDARFFNADTIAASAGLSHSYEAMQDLIFDFYGNYTRQTDIFNSALQFNNNAIGPPATPNVSLPIILNPFGTTPGVNPIAYNQFTGAASVTKTFDQAFVTLRGTAFNIVYDHSDNVPAPFQTSHDGASFWLSGRVGYNFPTFYVFAQGDGIFQRFDNSVFNTNGYRVIGGVGTKTQAVCSKVKSMADISSNIRSSRISSPRAPLASPGVRPGHPPRRQQRCLWWPSFLFPDPVLDNYSADRPDHWEFQRCCRPPFRRELLLGRPPLSCRRLMGSRGIGRSASGAATLEANSLECPGSIIMVGSLAPHSIMKYGGICC